MQLQRSAKMTVHIINANVEMSLISSHTGRQLSTPLVDFLVDDQTMQQSGAASDHQR